MTIAFGVVAISWAIFAFAVLWHMHRGCARSYQRGWDAAVIEHHMEPQMRHHD